MSASILIEAQKDQSRIPGTPWTQIDKISTYVYPKDANGFVEHLETECVGYAYPAMQSEDETRYDVETETSQEEGSSYDLLRAKLAGTPWEHLLPPLPDGHEDDDVTLTILW